MNTNAARIPSVTGRQLLSIGGVMNTVHKTRNWIVASLLLALCIPGTLPAATGTWTGGAGATWNTASNNWSGVSGATPWDSSNGANNIADFNTAGATPSVSGTIYVNGITFDATARISGGTAITLAGASPTITANAAATNSSVLSGSQGLITTGAGTLTLDAINTYTGGTIANGTTLVLNKGGATGAIRGALTINSGATVQLNIQDALGYQAGNMVTNIIINGGTLNNNVSGNNSASANWVLTGATMSSTGGGSFNIGYTGVNSLTTLASATQSTISGPVTLRSGNSLTITVADGPAPTDLLISSNINQVGGASGIIKEGAGCLVLSAYNSYTGGTTVNGGTLALNYGGTAAAIPGPLTINPGATVSLTAANALGWQSGWSVTSITNNGGTLDNALASANNGYLTTFYLSGGTVTGSGGWGFSFADTVDPVVSYASATTSVISASLALRSSVSNNHTFTVEKGTTPNGIDLKISGVIGEYGTGPAGLIKTGAGTLLLSGFNTYHGPTTVSNGTLLVNGSVTGTVTVVAGGTLGGTGVVSGVVTNSGAITAGADLASPGVFTVSNLVMGANTTYNWKYNATTNDEVVVLQKLVLPAVATVNVSRVMSGSLPAKGVLFSYGSIATNAGTLNGWVITGARPDTRAMVRNNQVLLVSPTGMILEIQ